MMSPIDVDKMHVQSRTSRILDATGIASLECKRHYRTIFVKSIKQVQSKGYVTKSSRSATTQAEVKAEGEEVEEADRAFQLLMMLKSCCQGKSTKGTLTRPH